MVQPERAPMETTRPRFVFVVLVASIVICGLRAGLELHTGQPLFRAFVIAAAATLCGLVGWFTYILVSRRYNGLITIPASMGSVGVNFDLFWSWFTVQLLVSISMGSIVGLSARVLDRVFKKDKARTPRPVGPLYDAQLDQPS